MAVKQIQAKAEEEDDQHDEGFDIDEPLRLLRGYAAAYPSSDGDVLSVEQPISFQMEEGIFYRGTVDMLVRAATGELIMYEHKTARALSSTLVQMYAHSPQTMGYAYCLSETLKEEVAYVMFNFLIKTKTPSYHREPTLLHRAYLLQWHDWALQQGRKLKTCIKENRWEENRYQCYPFAGKPCVYHPLCWYGESAQTLAFFREEESGTPSDALLGESEG